MGMPPAGGDAPWRPFCGVGRCLPLVSSLVPLTPMTHLKRLRLVGRYVTQTGTDSAHCAQVLASAWLFSELQRMALEPAFHAIVGGKLSAAHMTWQLRQSTAVNQPTVVVPEDRKNLLLVTFFNADPDETPSDRMTDDRIHKSVFKYDCTRRRDSARDGHKKRPKKS
eukprot:SAG25_NODE_436_length_8050_cov_15.278581_6_plen_167_part_00